MTLSLSQTVPKFRAACERVRRDGQRLGLVPTMGALHAGHLSLIEEARRRADQVFVTIFVNPTQFGPTEDLEAYPRDLEGDLARCSEAGVAHVFAPAVREMYPEDECTRVRVVGLTQHLCGASRSGHFEGVATIVVKLFAIVGECVAVFGRKDYQQLKVVERLTRDLNLPVEVVGHSTVRDEDGLALSSRNAYLSSEQRDAARAIPLALSRAVRQFRSGERGVGALVRPVTQQLAGAGLRIDYVSVADPEGLAPFDDDDATSDTALLAVAAKVGDTRLIDNVVLGEDPPPIADA